MLFGALAIVALASTSCGGAGGVGAACRFNSDCEPGLACFEGACGTAAATDAGELGGLPPLPELRIREIARLDGGEMISVDGGDDSPSDAAPEASTSDAGSGGAPDSAGPSVPDAGASDAASPPPLCDAPTAAACLLWCTEPCSSACAGGPFTMICGPSAPGPGGAWCCSW